MSGVVRCWVGVATMVVAISIRPAGASPDTQARPPDTSLTVTRLLDRPIIAPDTDPSIGANIQGPSLIRVPDWVPARLGKYYLYFADHKGAYIRLAYADDLRGPWRVHAPGSLQLKGSFLLTEPPSEPAEAIEKLRATPRPASLPTT